MTCSKFFRFLLVFTIAFSNFNVSAQEDTDLEKMLEKDTKPQKEYIKNAFKSSRVINGHSMEFIGKGVLDFRILHRFGPVNGGLRELFGLDQASMRMGFDYGVTKNLTLGVGRSTFNKELDGFVKYRIAHQHIGLKPIPVSIVWVSGITMNTTKINEPKVNTIPNRIGYYHQVIVGRKFGEAFTLQLSPTFVHRNLVDLAIEKNDMIAIGVGARIKISNRSAFIVDTYPILTGGREGYNMFPLSLGFDVETGGHVFQFHVSNARGMNEKSFITETTQDWSKGQVQLGFNLSRVFTIVKNTESSW